MSKIIPLVIQREMRTARQLKVELRFNKDRIISLDSTIKNLKFDQQRFATVLNQPLKPVTLKNIQYAMSKLDTNVEKLKKEIIDIRATQTELSAQLTATDHKIETLQSKIKLKDFIEDERKSDGESEDVSILSHLTVQDRGLNMSVSNGMDLNFHTKPESRSPIPSTLPPETSSIHGSLRLNESQSVSVNIDATHDLHCNVAVTATKGIAEAIISSSKEKLKNQIQEQGLHVSDFKVNGV